LRSVWLALCCMVRSWGYVDNLCIDESVVLVCTVCMTTYTRTIRVIMATVLLLAASFLIAPVSAAALSYAAPNPVYYNDNYYNNAWQCWGQNCGYGYNYPNYSNCVSGRDYLYPGEQLCPNNGYGGYGQNYNQYYYYQYPQYQQTYYYPQYYPQYYPTYYYQQPTYDYSYYYYTDWYNQY
jgi:hypothetical protein